MPTSDHTTGKAIGRLLGLTHKEVNRPENREWLSRPCHEQKDKKTTEVIQTLQKQKKGNFVGFGQHPPIGIDERGYSR